MLDLVLAKFGDGHFMAVLLASIGCATTVILAMLPLLQNDNLDRRIKAVSVEREKIRSRERERLAMQTNGGAKPQLRMTPGGFSKQIVDTFNLSNWLSTETAKQQLAQAGFRGANPEYAFLTFRLVAPIVFFVLALVYVFFIAKLDQSPIMKIAMAMAAAYIGMKAPEIFLSNKTKKRQLSMNRAYPNMVDLLIICAESGMSIEHAVRKVSLEIGPESIDLAEELSLLAAELSYLEQRRTAFENFNLRTGMESVKQLTTVLVQSEKYGTPLGAALRVLAQESRDARMNAAEKKAAALPPTLTVPMIVFFLPALFCAILGPAVVEINHWN
jgi:tight adherence protein C